MTEKLDLYDMKILDELNRNSKKSASEISKKVRLSKVSVNQRIKKLQEKGIIKKFVIQINYNKLGYMAYHIYYKLQNISSEKESEFDSYLINNNSIGYIVKLDGNFDIFFTILVKNNQELDKILCEIANKFGKYIKQRSILSIIHSQDFGRRYLIQTEDNKIIQPTIRKETKEIFELDKINNKILQKLSQEARTSTINFSKTLNLSLDIITYRVKKLIKENIIQKFTIDLNNEKFGNSFFKVLITLNHSTNEKTFLSKIATYKNLIRINRMLGEWNIELDFEIENNLEMRKLLKEIKNKFGSEIETIDLLFAYKINKLNYYPF